MQPPRPIPSSQIDLTLLATSDLHGLLSEGDAISETESLQGLARIATYIQETRRTDPNVILVDNGDFLQGSALCDLAATLGPKAMPHHPVLQVMNHLAYDAVGLGNHEFDFGLDFLLRSLSQAEFPILCSNLRNADQAWRPSLFLRRSLMDAQGQSHEVNIGFVSVMPPQILGWTQLGHQISASPMVQSAERQARQLRKDGADLVIALAHTGIGDFPLAEGAEHAGAAIAALPEIDVIICGHAHALFPDAGQPSCAVRHHRNGTVCGTPAVMPNFNGSHVGQIKLSLTQQDGTWRINTADSRAVSMKTGGIAAGPIPQDPSVLAHLAPFRVATRAHLRREVGHLPQPMHSYFAGLPLDPSCALTALAKLRFAQQNLPTETLNSLPLLAASSAFRCGGRAGPDHYTDVAAGPVSRTGLYALHPFQNTICARILTGWQIKDWLEMAAASFAQITAEQPPQPLMDPRFPGYNFDSLFGLSYQIDLTQPALYDPCGQRVAHAPAQGRIQNLTFGGGPISPTQSFVVLTNSYRAGGGGNIPHLREAPALDLPAQDMRDLVQNLLARDLQTHALPPCPWRFAPIPKGRALFHTSPAAQPFLPNTSEAQEITQGITQAQPRLSKQGFLELKLAFDPDPRNPLLAFPKTQAYISD